MFIPTASITREQEHAPVHSCNGYEIVNLTVATNQLIARQATAQYAVSLSGGLGSAIAGERAVRRYGRGQVTFWFADVLKEDEDLYRFLHDLMKRWGGTFYWFRSGMRPENVWKKHHIIPNNRMCPCSFELKVKYYRAFILAMPTLPTVILGYKPAETSRQGRTCVSYAQAIPESRVEYPLLWDPVEQRDLATVCQEELGIVPPRVYALGFDYNNCGTDCCRSGIGGRILEAIYFPERYQQAMEWEEMMRKQGGSLAGKAFCARVVNGQKIPLTLREILHEYVPLARSYLQTHPHQHISEKTLLREIRKWQRTEVRGHERVALSCKDMKE